MAACDEKKPYIFISYSHKDADKVLTVLNRLRSEGFNVWFDGGIEPGTEWDENIASHVQGCSYFIAFISRNYLDSSNCKDEINYARDLEKEQLLVYLEDVELPSGMAMRMNRLQAIFINKYNADCIEEAYRRLFTASGIEVTKVYKSETINTNIKAFSEAFESKDEPADKMSGSKVDKNNSKKKSEKKKKNPLLYILLGFGAFPVLCLAAFGLFLIIYNCVGVLGKVHEDNNAKLASSEISSEVSMASEASGQDNNSEESSQREENSEVIISFDEIVLPSEININPTDGTLIVEADGESEETSYDSSEFSNKSLDIMTDEELLILVGELSNQGKHKEKFKYVEELCRRNNGAGYGYMGFHYCFYSDPVDVEKGIEYFEYGAKELNSAYSAFGMSQIYYYGIDGYLQRDYDKALEYGILAYDLGDTRMADEICFIYNKGYSSEGANLKKAYEWAMKSEEHREEAFPAALIGYYYYKGIVVEVNYELAAEYFEKAYNRGNPYGYIYLGDMYRDGCGFEKDTAKAIEYYQIVIDNEKVPKEAKEIAQKRIDDLK